MDTALNPAAAHRSDARLHVLAPSSTRLASDGAREGRLPPLGDGPASVLADRGKRPPAAAAGLSDARLSHAPGARRPWRHGLLETQTTIRNAAGPARRQDRRGAGVRRAALCRDVAPGRRSQSRARSRLSRTGRRLPIRTARRHAELAHAGCRIISPGHHPARARASVAHRAALRDRHRARPARVRCEARPRRRARCSAGSASAIPCRPSRPPRTGGADHRRIPLGLRGKTTTCAGVDGRQGYVGPAGSACCRSASARGGGRGHDR